MELQSCGYTYLHGKLGNVACLYASDIGQWLGE